MGMFSAFVDIAINLAAKSEAQQIIKEGLAEALYTMENMCGNPGQTSVYENHVAPAFKENLGPIEDGWEDVDIGDYMDFMGEIVGEGNDIMSNAYDEAQQILEDAQLI